MWQKLLWIALAGALGTLARYGLSSLAQRTAPPGFPWSTLAVNTLGCFLFGLIWSLAENSLNLGQHARLAVFTGFLGAFTTFSTYAFESGQMLRDTQWLSMAINMITQNGLGIIAVLLGFALGRAW